MKKNLDKLVYMDDFKAIDSGMSDSNIGARPGRNIRDHLFILHEVIHSVVRGEDECIDFKYST